MKPFFLFLFLSFFLFLGQKTYPVTFSTLDTAESFTDNKKKITTEIQFFNENYKNRNYVFYLDSYIDSSSSFRSFFGFGHVNFQGGIAYKKSFFPFLALRSNVYVYRYLETTTTSFYVEPILSKTMKLKVAHLNFYSSIISGFLFNLDYSSNFNFFLKPNFGLKVTFNKFPKVEFWVESSFDFLEKNIPYFFIGVSYSIKDTNDFLFN